MGSTIAEALTLGLASGPVCIASCGPVLVPCLAAQAENWRGTGRSLAIFLGGRLAGYLAFAVLVWTLGMALPLDTRSRALVYGFANLALAVSLALYAWMPRHFCARRPSLVQIGVRRPATLTLGFLTGLNLCPPFAAAGVRAAESQTLVSAVAFFLLFFIGTTVWFLPALAVSPLRRIPAAATVARFTMIALAVYYAYLAIIALSWRFLHV